MDYRLILSLFGEEGAEGGAQEGEQEGMQDPQAPQEPEREPIDRAAQFKELIKGEYKDEFQRVMQDNLNRRFKETDELRRQADEAHRQAEAARPLMELLATRYGVRDAGDAAAILKAAEADDGYYEEEAARKGLTVEQLKAFKHMERENAQLKEAAQERERAERASQVQARWAKESEETKAIYGGFDFQQEAQNPDFARLLRAGVDVKTAYEVAHHDDILSGAMQYTAQRVQEKTINDIRTRGMRPDEGALGAASAGDGRLDISKLTREQMREIEERVLHGERITFNE